MPLPRSLPYRPDRASIVIVKGHATTSGTRYRFELTWVRYVTDDGDTTDVFRQRRWDTRTGLRHDGELPIDYGTTPAAMFDSYLELYRRVADAAAGVPTPAAVDGADAPCQLHLPGVG